ncbi:MBL fold metallo-hydrolase [Paenibacillus hodogayensis]|uniref:MBL fold metallo-hydrolase n=1 Tax=Paenibacillus hodogayensis TaxID=279208 RepID=A0ABV5VU64_9BACL
MGRTETIHPTLVCDDRYIALIDTGYPGQLPLLAEAIGQAGFLLDRLTHIVITHQDLDHIGNLPALVAASPGKVKVVASPVEQPYIQGENKS